MCFSTSYLLSKCGMPVCRLAEPTEVKTRCTPAALAASAAATPCRVSAPGPSGRRRHREERGRSFERLSERRGVFERRPDERRPGVRERLRLARVGVARDGADLVTSLEEAPRDGAALFTRGSRDDDGELLRHVLRPFSGGHTPSDVSQAARGAWNYVSHERDNRCGRRRAVPTHGGASELPAGRGCTGATALDGERPSPADVRVGAPS